MQTIKLNTKTRQVYFKLFAVFCFITAIYHLVGIFYKLNDAPPLRHLLFVGINLFCAYGILKRPWYFVYLFAVLLVQQYYSHGGSIISMWAEKKQVDWLSVAVLIALSIGMVCLLEDAKGKGSSSI